MIKHTALVLCSIALAGVFVSCAAPTQSAGSTPIPTASAQQGIDVELTRLKLWLSGSFSSAQQAEEDGRYFEIHLRSVPIWINRDDAEWLYVEQAAAQALDRPYRQRVYRLTRNDEGKLVSTVFALPGNPLEFAGAWEEPGVFDAMLSPLDLEERTGCAIELEYSPSNNSFIGSTVGDNCQSSLGGASYATARVTLTGEELRSWDQGFNAEGEQVWGAVAGPYIFRRLD